MKKTVSFLAALWLALAQVHSALAQQYPLSGSPGQSVGSIVIMCVNGSNQAVPCGNNTTPLQIAGTFSATLSGFQPTPAYASLTATNASARVALPSGTVAVVYNTGTTAVSCTLGNGTVVAVASEDQIQPSSWLAYTVGSNADIACIDQTGSASNVVVISGGAGLPTGAGGGSAGGSSAITTWAGGTLGAMANYGTSPGAVLAPGVNAFITNTPAVSQSGTWNIGTVTTLPALPANQSVNVNQMGGTSINSGCVAALNGFPTSIPATVCGVFGSYVLNATPLGQAVAGSSNPVVLPVAQTFGGATGGAPPANAIYLASLGSGATAGHLAGLISCDSHVFKHITTATDTMFVQGVASQSIYVCSWRSRAAGTATWLLETEADQSASCNGTLAQINGIATEAANTGETWGGNFWSGLKGSSGFGLCAKSTGTGGVDVDVWYAQF